MGKYPTLCNIYSISRRDVSDIRIRTPAAEGIAKVPEEYNKDLIRRFGRRSRRKAVILICIKFNFEFFG